MHNFSYSLLDEILKNEGLLKCREFFRDRIRQNISFASDLINDTRITFPCLYVLMPVLDESDIFDSLKDDLKEALGFTRQIIKQEPLHIDKTAKSRTTFRWMFDTGCIWHNSGGDFNGIIDVTVSVLVNIFHDMSIAKQTADLIFKRNRTGENIHDLVWSYFRISSPHTLKLIARRLLSDNDTDVKLAQKLLNIQGGYNEFTRWLDKNGPYLYFTGESFQYSSRPVIFKADYTCKYMCKAKRTEVFSSGEKAIINKFETLSEEEQDTLSEYSLTLNRTDKAKWGEFFSKDITMQLKEARDGADI